MQTNGSTFIKQALLALAMLVNCSIVRANDLYVCKFSDTTGPVTGSFDFVLDGTTNFSLTVGNCRFFPTIGVGQHTVTETGKIGVVVTHIDVQPDLLVSFDLAARTATVRAVDEIPNRTTNVYFYNKMQSGSQGCTPGFWKQSFHFGYWKTYLPSQLVSSVFAGVDASLAGETLEAALQGGGGPKLVGKEEILLRAAVAALLNASNGSVSYPFTAAEVITHVNAAIATGDLQTIVTLATRLDNANNGNGGCPLSGKLP